MRTTTTLLCAALAVIPGCACDTVPASALQDCQAAQVLPDKVQTDILFVIDDSGSMSQEQANLAANLGAFIDTLAASPVQNDFRIGVTNTSVEGYRATQQAYGGTGIPYPDGAIVAIAQAGGLGISGDLIYDTALYPTTAGWGGARFLDAGQATLQQDFKANVLVGVAGSGREQPFRAARLALTDRLADANAGFLRDGARLAVFFLTDEDDCSGEVNAAVGANAQCHDLAVKDDPLLLDSIAATSAFLLGPIGGQLRDVEVGAIAGFDPATLEPSCGDTALCPNTACSTALDKADRFGQLHAALGDARMQIGSICDTSFRDTLLRFARRLTPSALPLQGTPADWRMLAVKLTKASGVVVACAVAIDPAPAADAIYTPPAFGRPAQLTFQNACQLELGDRIDVSIVCAG